MGIPLKTRHREVAPGQYEFAPLFGFCTTQIDQNLMVMQIMEEVAPKHGLACLNHEKPFNNVNGSGKHNNWSIATSDGVNLFNFKQLKNASGNKDIFPVIMASVIKAVDEYGDLMRMSISTPGNDFRLGACEAPPAIMSVYLGESMTQYMEAFMNGDREAYNPLSKPLNMGDTLPSIILPNEDRNRTSPFPYGGHRFEFRAVGSGQNVSLEFADAIDGGRSATEVAAEAVRKHWRVVFNGNGYDSAHQEELTKRGLWRIDSAVDAINRYIDPKNTALFQKLGVLQPDECAARRLAMLNHYTGTIEIEVKCMIDMINQHVLPSMRDAGVGYVQELETAVKTLQSSWDEIHHTEDEGEKAAKARTLRLETMVDVRKVCDAAEAVCPADLWTLSSYKEDVLIIGNESANDSDTSDAWNETEVPINISVVTEAVNVSDDLLEDDNESTELDGNLSDATEENVSEVWNSSNDSWILPEDVLIIGNESANDSDASDAWNETEAPINISVVTEAINVSDDLL
ncbi:glnA3, partial [Symbiodinium microadriaticum]